VEAKKALSVIAKGRSSETVRDRLEKNAFSDRITASEDLRASFGDARV
jgi:hypothetical protein